MSFLRYSGYSVSALPGWVPGFPIGTVHRDLEDQFKIPFEATQGGKATIYPEYMRVIEQMRSAPPSR